MQTRDVLAELRPWLHDPYGELRLVGRMPGEVREILVTLGEPADPPPGTLVVAPHAVHGPAVAIGDAALAHPEGLLASLLTAVGARREEPVGSGRAHLRKLTLFVPESHLGAVRDAITGAGAGRIGRYSDCTFTLHGEGTFRPLPGSHPFLGREGSREFVPEARLEAVYAPYREAAILAAMREAHPYEEIAYDIVELANPDPTYGSVRLGDIEPRPAAAALEQVLSASGSNALFVCDGGRLVRRVALGRGEALHGALDGMDPDLVVTDRMPPATALSLHARGATIAELRDLDACAMHRLATRMQDAVSVPVRDAAEGLVWRSWETKDGIDRS